MAKTTIQTSSMDLLLVLSKCNRSVQSQIQQNQIQQTCPKVTAGFQYGMSLMTELPALIAGLQHHMCRMTELPAIYGWATVYHVSHDQGYRNFEIQIGPLDR